MPVIGDLKRNVQGRAEGPTQGGTYPLLPPQLGDPTPSLHLISSPSHIPSIHPSFYPSPPSLISSIHPSPLSLHYSFHPSIPHPLSFIPHSIPHPLFHLSIHYLIHPHLEVQTSSIKGIEFSASEVISYLMGWGDQFISHYFVNIYWNNMLALIKRKFPSIQTKR